MTWKYILQYFMYKENIVPDLKGKHYGPGSDLAEGIDVCVYTTERKSRPWLGRVRRVFPESLEFEINWYQVDITVC